MHTEFDYFSTECQFCDSETYLTRRCSGLGGNKAKVGAIDLGGHCHVVVMS
jgi:hypothetical protein